MRYIRQFTRKQERNQTKTIEQQKHDLDLARKVLTAVTAFSFIGNPFAAMASTVTRVDGTKVDFQNNVGNIYAEKIVNNNTAVNRFQDFKIDAGDIANMYFQTGQNQKWADNLVNFVNTRIDVHGTLNAIKENKIGGNLFFLSPEGMAVGKSGVINVGSLYVMTPANVSLDEAAYTYHGLSDLIETDTEDALNRMMTLNIPVNSSGTISVLGKINSVGDVKMVAAKIAVGKNVSGEDWADGTKNGEIVKDAAIRTGNGTEFNFADLVNIKDASGKEVVNAGLGNTLTAIESGNGDIVLSAKAEDKNTDYSDFKELGQKLLDITVDFDLPKTVEASVESYGTITAKGDAVLKAEATNGNKDWAEETLDQNTPNGVNNPDYVPVPAADADNYVQVIANVNVQGDVTAGGNVELTADADNTYVDNGTALTDKVGKVLGTAITPMAANVMILSNKAQITVGKEADVTAGGTIDVHANAVLDGTAGAAANGRKLIKKVPDAIPSAAVGYANAENSASVQIDGTLTANGENVKDESTKTTKPAVNVSAYAEENLSNTATMNLKSGSLGAGSSALAASVAVSDSVNTADVAINGAIKADKGDASITADTNTLLTANAATKSPDDTIGSTAVNVMTHKGQANIVINGDITAQNVDIDATNYVDENTITANNSLGMGKLMADAMNAVNVGGITNALKQNPLVQSIINKDGTATADKPGLFKQLSEKLAVGAAIVVADETNSANVTFGKTADITATAGNVRADADVNIYDSHIYASGTANSYKKSESGSTDTVTVGAGVVYAGMNNTASVVFEDGSGANADESHASITAAKDINITSGTTIEYNRPERIKREIDRSIENLKYAVEAIKNLPEYEEEKYKDVIDGLKNLQEKLTNYAKTYSSDFMDAVNDPDAITAEGTANRIFDAAAGAVGIYNDVMDLQQNVNGMLDVTSPFGAVVSNALGVVTNAVAFTDPNNYANVAASSSSKGGQDSTKLSVAGSVTVTDFNNTSSVDVGKFTELKVGQNLDLKSVNAIEDVTITGKTKFWKNDADAKGGVGIGASVNYQNFDTYSKVIVDEGASLTAGDISIGSESDIFHVGAMLGAGKSDGSAINGMVTITDNDSYNEVVVDSDAILEAIKNATAKTNGTIDIWANNNTSVNNAILSISASGDNVGAGIGVALNNIDVQNSAQIINNDGTDDEDDELEGKISASALSVNAETTGLINAISIAGGMTSSGEDESGEEGFFDKIKAPFDKVNETKDNVLEGVSNVSNKLQSVLQTMDLNASAGSATAGDEEAGVPGFSFAGAGSVSLNLVNDTTKAVVDGANIQLENDGQLQVGARDSAFTGAWSGAAGLSFRKGQSGGSGGNTSVAVSGAVGVNDIDNEITALVKNSTITGAKDIDVAAVSGGTTIAAGLGATLTSDSTGGKNYSGGASVSVNLIDKDVNANMDGVTLTGVAEGEDKDQKAVTDIDVAAYESDVQVTGGVRADIATGGGSLVGGGVTVADIQNNINAGITGGSYTDVNDVTVKGMLATTQVTAAVSAGVATGGSGTNNAFSGAAVYNGLSNDIHASIDGANIVAEGTVAVAAKDTEASSDEAKPYQALLGDYNEHNQFAAERGIDTAGASFYEGLDTADETIDYDGNAGSTIVGAAVVATGSNGNAAGAAINIADIDNDFTASVNNASVTADAVLAEADADTLLVGAAGGVAAGTKTFGGMGSVTWQDIDNDVTAQFVNSQITTNVVTAKADNNTQAINVAGSVSVGKSTGAGAALAYNALDNTIGAYMKGNSITALGDNVDVVVDADNTGKVYGIGAGVSASTKAAINGSVAVNRGGSNTEAVIDKSDEKESYIEDAGAVKVTADDDTYRLAVVGSVSASGKAAVGGGVAYNDVGGSSAGSESSGQSTLAAIRNTNITTADNSEQAITVEANDKARLYTISVGVAAAGTAAVQGSAATALINKNVSAAFENSSVDKDGGTTADVTVEAQNASEITTSADAVSVGGRAGVGAGVAVNRIVQQTNAAVNGSQMNVKDLMVHANGTPRIENVGVGIAAAGQGAGVAGSVSVNMIDNDVTAHIGSGANIDADGSVGVVATSDEQISNYSGMLAAAGQGAGVGISVSVNQIQGETSATVGDERTNTTVSAKGNGDGLTTSTDISEEDINNTLISSDTVDVNTTIGRQDETRKGFIVDASSTRDMKSFLINIGAAGQGAGVAPTVNVNMIDGATTAGISHTVINKGVSAGDVFVNAGDYTNMSGFVGSGGIAGMGAGVGLGSDTNTVSRDVEAVVDGSDVNAKAFEIDAESMQGVSSFTVGAGVAGIGGGVAGVVTVTDLANTTKAELRNSNVTANTVNVTADHKGIVNAGNVGVGAAGIGAGVGLSVGVLKDNSETYAIVRNDEADDKSIEAAGDVSISAENTTTVKPSISATGIAGVGGGVAGATSINNLNSKVVTDIANASIISNNGSISGTADNTFNVEAYMGSQAAGVGGVGVGVTVNTIDSTVQMNVSDSELQAAQNVTLTADETRHIQQTATNVSAGGAAVGANIAITTVGQAVENIVNEDGEVISNASDKIDEANEVYGSNADTLLNGAGDALKTAGIDEESVTPSVGAAYGGGKDSQITVNISNSDVTAGGTVKAEATEHDDIDMTLGSGSAGGAALNASVGILDVHRNVGVNITGGSMTANAIDVDTDITGAANLDVYQGSAGVVAGNAAVGQVSTSGASQIDIMGTKLTGSSVAIVAQDTSTTGIQAVAAANGVGALGALVAEASNDSDISVSLIDAEVDAKEDVTIQSEKANTVTAEAVNEAGGLVGGAGMGATVTDTGSSKITLENAKVKAGNTIGIDAETRSALTANINSDAGGWFAGGSVSIAQVNAGTADDRLSTAVEMKGVNTFEAAKVDMSAMSNVEQHVDMDALSISAYGAALGNVTETGAYTKAEITQEREDIFKGASDDSAADVSFNADNTVSQTVDTSGISAAGAFATGTNISTTTSDLRTNIALVGSGKGSRIGDFKADAGSYASISNHVNGDGGAIADISPFAAKANNTYKADTDVTIGGNWNASGSFTAQALNGMDIDVLSEATRAAVVGGSGTWLRNTIDNAANVTLDNATITTDGAQSYVAQNQVDYVGEIDGSGYGGINVNATDYKDDLDFTAGVDMKHSTLTGAGDEGSITAFASTEGTIHSKNNLKSAGVIPVALAFSDHAITYNNSVNVTDSMLTTDKKDQDITLAATDDTDVKLETIADTQGGAVGAASAEAKNVLDRSNKITVDKDSKLHSTNDVNLYAGANTEGISSSLDLQVLADAYNKTVIPLATAPKVDNAMTQANQVSVGGTVESVRHINASAAKGATTVTESAQEYNLYQGTSGSSTVASTTLGETVPHENGDANFVEVKEGASLTAGVHNKLDLTISGEIPLQSAGEDGKVDSEDVDLSNITVTVSAGAGEDWFDTSTVQKGTTPIKNNLMDRYNEVVRLMGQYEEGTSEYASYNSERESLLLEMKRMGMAKEDINGNLTPSSEIEVPAVSLPDIVVSGGNINIDSDSLKGGGNLTAQGAPQIKITNESDAYLVVNDVTIQDAGGQIRMNGSTLTANTAGNEMSAAQIHADGVTGGASQINISGTASKKEGMQADIGVFGDIINTSGDVTISNKSYNLNILGNISGRDVSLIAENGSVTQTSTEGFINIGGDPVTKYQFSKDVANAIQEYIYDQFVADNNYKIPSFTNYEEYINWIKTNIVAGGKYGITEADLVWKEDDPADPGNKIVAGGNVYINGLNVNIGGLVQSGYGKYSVTLDSSAQAKVEELDKEWQGKQEALSDSAVMANEKYLINAGGQVYNQETGVYDYEIRVYYNPSTGELLTDSVSVSGGKIYITGNISSTGNGKIMAMDGAADISINTANIDRDVKVSTITNNDINGLISITDKNKTDGKGHYLVTEYRNGEQRSYYSGGALSDWSAVTGDMGYDPEKGLQYQWTGGVSGEVTTKYQYTEDFLFWGLLDYGKSDEFVAGLKAEGKVPSQTPISSGETAGKENGVVITKGNGGKDFSITGSYSNSTDEKYSDISPDMKYDGFWGKVFGYGTTTYTWTGKKGTASSTTTSVAADKHIQIGFIGNGNGSGNISVTSGGDMTLAGNISNASVVDGNSQTVGKGSVSLTSQNGAIAGNGIINSDDVNLSAAGDINVNHAAIGSDATVNIASDNGDIHFTSSKGDLSIEQVVTGGANPITAETGSVYIEAAGSILDAHTGDYAVKGQRIDLISKMGSIGTKNNALTILGGSELYSSDTMASSVNASAAGDIVLTQTSGNMRLGTIESTNGDAVLIVTNGSFVDAHPSENSSSSSAQDKIDRWLESGLIDVKDKANESTNAADKAKAERVEALTNRANSLAGGDEAKVESYWAAADAFYNDEGVKLAKETYLNAVAEADGDKEKINAAYERYQKDYQDAKTKYFENKGFSDGEQDLITSYAEVSNSKNYGWSKNELLYAIQDTVLNEKPGEVLTVATPNVSAMNITLNAASGGIGIDGEAQTINYADLNKEENLKLLANAKAGDLTWDEANQQVTIRQQQAITVAADGAVSVAVEGNGNVYLAGVKGKTLDINDIETGGNVRLQGDDGVEVGSIKGGNLIIAGGEGSITSGNADDLYVHTELTGSLDANAKGDIYISETGDLDILTLATDKAAHLAATGSILMENVKDSTAQGRLNAAEVNLSAGGSIGGAGKNQAIRILDNGAVVNAEAAGGIWISGESGDGSTGNLVIGDIEGGSFDLTSVSDVSLGREGTDEDEALTGSITTKKGDASISAVNVDLADGTVNVGTNDFNVIATNGDITQSEASKGLTANHVNLSSTGSQLLLSETNQINSVTVKGLHNNSLTGNVEIHSAADSFDVQFGDTDGDTAAGITVNDGSIVIQHNGSADGKLTVTGSATTQKANGSDVNADISFSGKQSAIDVEGTMNAGDNFSATTESGAINITGTVTAHDGEVKATTNSGAISFGGDVTAMRGDVTAATGSGDVTFGGSVSAEEGNINAKTNAGAILVDGSAVAKTDILLESGSGAITVDGAATAGNDFKAHTGSGAINLGGSGHGNIIAESGVVTAHTGNGDISITGSITSAKDTSLMTGVVEDNEGNVTGVIEDAQGNISIGGQIVSGKDVIASTQNGSITFTGDVTANTSSGNGGNITASIAGTGDINVHHNITADMDVTLNTNSGNILFEGVQDGHEDLYVTSNHGDVTVSINEGGSGVIKDTNSEGAAGDWAHLIAAEGNVTVKHDGVGDVDLYELYAKQDAGVSVADGNLHLVNVSGNLVAVFVKSTGKEMDVENIEAAQQIAISGSNMDLDSIKQREDGDGFLVITPEGASEDAPIDNFVIGDIKTNGGVRFDHLWLNTGDIHVSEGALHLDKVYVQDKATFSTDDMTTNVFGSAPVYDDSVSSSYWVNTGINSPKDDLAAWNSDELNDKWMYIFFSPEGNVQISNGNLLHLADNNYVYNQRYSQVNWMNMFTDKDFYTFYDKYYAPELSYHERYGLTSGDGHSVENAEEDELIVE